MAGALSNQELLYEQARQGEGRAGKVDQVRQTDKSGAGRKVAELGLESCLLGALLTLPCQGFWWSDGYSKLRFTCNANACKVR